MGGTKIAGGIVGADGRVIATTRTDTPREGGDALTARVAAVAGELAAGCSTPPVGVGVSTAGAVSADGRRVLFAPNLPGWAGSPVGDRLTQATGLPVRFVYDGHAGALGEQWRGAARGARDVAFLIVGTGVGGGLILDGALRRGAHGVAGAVGWMVVDPTDADDAHARTHGTLEAVAAGPALVAAAARAGRDGVASPRDLAAAAADGDPAAQRVIGYAAERVAYAVTGVVSVLDLETVVLGGGVGAGIPAFVDTARETVAAFAQPSGRGGVRVVPAELGESAFLLGAARAALDRG